MLEQAVAVAVEHDALLVVVGGTDRSSPVATAGFGAPGIAVLQHHAARERLVEAVASVPAHVSLRFWFVLGDAGIAARRIPSRPGDLLVLDEGPCRRMIAALRRRIAADERASLALDPGSASR